MTLIKFVFRSLSAEFSRQECAYRPQAFKLLSAQVSSNPFIIFDSLIFHFDVALTRARHRGAALNIMAIVVGVIKRRPPRAAKRSVNQTGRRTARRGMGLRQHRSAAVG